MCAGDSGHVRYADLPTGSYVFRVLARTIFGEKAVVRRIIHIGMCTVAAVNSSFMTVTKNKLYSPCVSNQCIVDVIDKCTIITLQVKVMMMISVLFISLTRVCLLMGDLLLCSSRAPRLWTRTAVG